MFTSTSMLTLVSALVGAGAYAQDVPAETAPAVPLAAVADIRRARVEIYCGHNSQAVASIRAARNQLTSLSASASARTLAALDQAARLTRQNQYTRAELALESALGHLDSASRRG